MTENIHLWRTLYVMCHRYSRFIMDSIFNVSKGFCVDQNYFCNKGVLRLKTFGFRINWFRLCCNFNHYLLGSNNIQLELRIQPVKSRIQKLYDRASFLNWRYVRLRSKVNSAALKSNSNFHKIRTKGENNSLLDSQSAREIEGMTICVWISEKLFTLLVNQ